MSAIEEIRRALENVCDPDKLRGAAMKGGAHLSKGDRLKLREALSLLSKLDEWQPPAGWKLVPVEATSEMALAWDHAFTSAPEGCGYAIAWEDAYSAMLAAAPEPPK